MIKHGKDARIDRHSEQERQKTTYLFVLIVVASLLLGIFPALCQGQEIAFPEMTGGAATPSTPSQPGLAFGPIDSPASFHSPALPSSIQPPAPNDVPPSVSATSNPPLGNSVTPAAVSSPTMESLPSPREPRQKPSVGRRSGKTAAASPSHHSRADQVPTLPKEPTAQQLKEQPGLLRSVADAAHPFSGYFGIPTDPQSAIQGKALGVAELLDGVRNARDRNQLLHSYWELAGLLTEYNMRFDAELRVGQWFGDAEKSRDPVRSRFLQGTFFIFQQQRKATELRFVKKQFQLAEQLKKAKGISLSEQDYPIPADYPIFKKYETYADQIARTERARYCGHLIPIQERMLVVRRNGFETSGSLLQEAMKNPADAQGLVSALKQRTEIYADLVETVTEYNRMIADYATETIGPGVGPYRLIGALIELPNFSSVVPNRAEERKPTQVAAPATHLSGVPGGSYPLSAPSTEPAPGQPMPEYAVVSPPEIRGPRPERSRMSPHYAADARSKTFAPPAEREALPSSVPDSIPNGSLTFAPLETAPPSIDPSAGLPAETPGALPTGAPIRQASHREEKNETAVPPPVPAGLGAASETP